MEEVSGPDCGPSDDVSIAPTTRDVKDLLGSKEFDDWGVGVHYGMPEEVYFSLPAVSNSSLKQARRSFRHFEYYVTGGEYLDSPQKAFGRISHRALLEHDRFKETAIFSDFQDKRSKAWKQLIVDNPNKMILTKRESSMLTHMFQELSRNPGCMEIISGCKTEVTLLAIDPVTKLRLKARMDLVSIDKPYIGDYKTCEDAKPTYLPERLDGSQMIRHSKFERNANLLGYENQAAFYLYMSELAGIPKKWFSLIAQERKPPCVPCPYVYGFETIEEATEENRESLNRVRDAVDARIFKGYSDTAVVIARPSFARK